MEIAGYPNYLIYDDGRCWSKYSKKFLKPKTNKVDERLRYNLYVNGTCSTFTIHGLVAEHYLPPKPTALHEVDHKDGNPINNHINNLRWATSTQQKQNTKLRSDNSSGFKGVSFDNFTGKYLARICHNKKQMNLGLYETAEEASEVYELKATELFGEFKRITNL